MIVKIHPLEAKELKYVVIACKYKEDWLFVRHKERQTWEIPGGHIENEGPDQAAARELFEETGALKYTLDALCDYSVLREIKHLVVYTMLKYMR